MKLASRDAQRLLRAVAAEEISPSELRSILAALERPVARDPTTRLARARGWRILGRLDDAVREATNVLSRARDARLRAEAHSVLGAVARARGELDDALRHAGRALAIETKLGDAFRRAVALGELGAALAAAGRLKRARAVHEEALGKLRSLPRSSTRRAQEGTQLSHLGVALHRAGRMVEARRAHAAALAIHREIKHRRLEGAESMHLGYVEHQLGRFAASRRSFEAALSILREVGDRSLEGVALSYFGALEAEDQRPERAGPMLHEALAIHRETANARHEATTWLHLAHHHLALGETEEARSCLERARRMGEGRVEPEQRAWVLALLGARDGSLDFEDAATREAISVLRGERPSTKATSSSRLRLAIKLAPANGLAVLADGTGFARGDAFVDLKRRGPLARVLGRLVAERKARPGGSVSWQELLAVGWPGERPLADAGFMRVRNALFQLRKLGLKAVIQTTSDGYRIDPGVSLSERRR